MYKLILGIAVFAALLLVPGVSQQAFAGGVCTQNSQCNDENSCTFNLCAGKNVFGVGLCTNPPRTGFSCNDGDGNSCTVGVCGAVGQCNPVPNVGASCNDGDSNVCTIGICGLQGNCAAAPNVGASCDNDDGNVCTGTCGLAGECNNLATAKLGNSCDDNNVCTNASFCIVGGLCVGADPDGDNNKDDCGDGASTGQCDEPDSCFFGVCNPNPKVGADCTADNPSQCQLDAGLCGLLGECTPLPKVGAACENDDGNVCTGTCGPAGQCNNLATAKLGNSCDDDNVCTNASFCIVGGLCIGADPDGDNNNADCGDPSDTECSNPDRCSFGVCIPNHEDFVDNVKCDSGNECRTDGRCNGLGGCTRGLPILAREDKACGDPLDCIDSICAGLTGNCEDIGFVEINSACGTNNVCENQDGCDGGGNCIDTGFKDIFVPCGDDGTECTNQDFCDGQGACDDKGFKPVATACGDGTDTECTAPDTCDGLGGCESNDAPAAATCGDDGTECTNQDTCDGSGTCDDNGFKPIATACGDGEFCNGDETCDGVGDCQPGTPPDSDDGVSCTDDSCDEVNDIVVNDPDDLDCDDLNVCTAEFCDPNNGCNITDVPDGTLGTQCDTGLLGVCAQGTDFCTTGSLSCPQNETASDETCDTLDNDCDGFTDENDQGEPLTQSCYTGPPGTLGVGLCTAGIQTCDLGAFGSCIGEITPIAEILDGQDNDCDGEIDEDFVMVFSIDVKPFSDPNSVNCNNRNGQIPVAVLSSELFDATTIVPGSITLNGVHFEESHGKFHFEDVDMDGKIDVLAHYVVPDVCSLFDKKDKFPEITLRANNGEIIFEASDIIRNIKAK